MTLAFTFQIKDAWVIVADRKRVSMDDNVRDRDLLYIKFFTDNITKIKKISKNLIFVGAGRKDILEKTIEVIGSSPNLQEVLNYKKRVIDNICSNFEIKEIDLEEFLIIDKDTQKGFKFNIRSIRDDDEKNGFWELDDLELENNFIGTYESVVLGNVKIDIGKLKQNTLETVNKKFSNECGRLLSIISLDNLYSVGHPQIHGFDIWIISKDKIKKIYAEPTTKFRYGVKEE